MRPPTQPIAAPPADVAHRLRTQLFHIRSVWFPSRNDLRDWDQATEPLYIRWLDDNRFEIGPRLESMWAACFSPVLRGELQQAEEATTRLVWSRSFPRFTMLLLSVWTILIGLWGAVLVSAINAGREEPGMLGFWALLAGGAAASVIVGGWLGGKRLADGIPWLLEIAATEPVDEDW